MIYLSLGIAFGLLTAVCWFFVVLHAFQRSVGTGVLVLFVPFFIFYYAFAQFEHPKKGPIVAGLMTGLLLMVALPLLEADGSPPRRAVPSSRGF